ncbi:MAG: glucose-1-phosphate adenylyltransferase [Gammaproteobacteria bacterium]|jgi:glucose-1-phosphate adenylyltransferase|nr:MAG: glucose-1-phosphate adenylyltransferase [Gammaproteobacteria bacterium SG8_31]
MSNKAQGRYVSSLTRDTLGVILAGGRGSRLKQLTLNRAKPATPFGGKYRIIDFPLSNCVNSGIRRIAVMTQYKAHDLIIHLQRAWGHFRGEFGEHVEILPAQQQIDASWYKGTADAVYQNLSYLERHGPRYVLLLAGDHIYKMDYGLMLARHADSGADITVGTVEVPVDRAREFGVVAVDEKNRIKEFKEKPENPEPIPGREGIVLASMGIYVFTYDHLRSVLEKDARDPGSVHDFGKNIIPAAIGRDRVSAYVFQNAETGVQQYWRDVGNVDAFYEANMELTSPDPELNLYDANWPIWTYQEQCPPAKFVSDAAGKSGVAIGSMVSGGCRVNGGVIRDSLLFSNVVIEEGAYLEGAVVLPNSRVEPGCRLRRVVIDDNCRIPASSVIGEDHDKDAQRFFVTRDGVVLVTRQMLEA